MCVCVWGGGVQLPISIETHLTFDFSGGGGSGPSIPPLDPHMFMQMVFSKVHPACHNTANSIKP